MSSSAKHLSRNAFLRNSRSSISLWNSRGYLCDYHYLRFVLFAHNRRSISTQEILLQRLFPQVSVAPALRLFSKSVRPCSTPFSVLSSIFFEQCVLRIFLYFNQLDGDKISLRFHIVLIVNEMLQHNFYCSPTISSRLHIEIIVEELCDDSSDASASNISLKMLFAHRITEIL